MFGLVLFSSKFFSMQVDIYVRQFNSIQYEKLSRELVFLPRVDEVISFQMNGSIRYFQILAVHHSDVLQKIEIYSIQIEPTWEIKIPVSIGFASNR